MPIYEFYCEDCNTIFSFFSRRINTTARPTCPKCGRVELTRQMSVFSAIGRAKEESDQVMPDFDEAAMERALAGLAREAENLNEEDPRQMAGLMRKFSERTGLHLGEGMEEALARLEAGEDPEQVEQEMGDVLEGDEPFAQMVKKGRSRARGPFRDETLYEL